MPLPHEVSKEFFVPDEDLPFFGADLMQNTNEQIANRINDLLHLFNMLDAAFGRNNNANNNNNESQNSESNAETETDKTVENSPESSNENSEENNTFNIPDFNFAHEGTSTQQDNQHDSDDDFENRNSYL